ncbi:methionine--tRNA ligase [Rhodococcus sp. BP-252]|uniref:methionine--tRNA ligase n=1 Tax=unclassified Rhodococcus (in: high G+C Gram-positive bacteria) TaxID=192944 RepID=UPI001C9AA5DD|nr:MULTISPECIES: methionine--tRNA ligase [unclassified Rhodococcus (in: high G+C Gram-positive bacteria)]MBY6414609.1 methionine--tRNA ligase [Rhodococcus sp. BP-320]MBY6419366.1 methionine--tRNA ligase [Rhodococcus sp. BP-321]MBY6424348.1 methionine--tRNA ligase [Rhodococcus sp. BP-324]MBY6429445.1 methionine--tRNA ligase [Rhodococcus sp. BP-323]MBY6431964.1 methionine--tRNA ligase [Rhodococcus sp. BP-322]
MTAPADASRPTFYVTTAIAYPNGAPHIGHAYEYISTDVIARFKRLDGYDVMFLTGTDEHGLKMQQTAVKEGIDVRDLAARNSDVFQELDKTLDISYDRFIRTTDADHLEASKAIWTKMVERGDIYLDTYAGWYSVRDEAFYTESETTVVDDGSRVATETKTPVEWTEESTYFFRLSAYQDKLLELYETQPEFIAPATRRNEIVNFVKSGLKDLSISRTTFDWGVQVPNDPDHVMYVWVDALTNYLTGVGYPDTSSEKFRKFWPASLHIIGKDITRFHTVFWPAFLMSAGIELPQRVFVHGFLNNKGEKMSKSVGNVVDPFDLVAEFGLDPLRFFLLREVSYGQDGSYSPEAIVTRMNADLSNELGNLAQRSLTMVAKNLEGKVPTPGEFTADDEALLARADALLDICRKEFDVQALHSALEAIWSVLGETNRYFSQQEPWVLRKTDPARMATVLYVTLEVLRIVGILVQPVMPGSAAKILEQLGNPAHQFSDIATRIVPGEALPAPSPVFPKYE